MTGSDPILIAGGGIGGLVAALALHQRGMPVRVFESSKTIRPLGVGINLLPHSVKVLANLGLLDDLREVAVETAELRYVNKYGQLIWRESRGIEAGYEYPQLSIHRGQLQLILLRAVHSRLGHDVVWLNHSLDRFDQDHHGVVAHFIDRSTGQVQGEVRGRALIGADGIHSVVRHHFYRDEGPARYSGRMLWRAVTEAPAYLTGRSMIMAGHQNQKFVCYPISRQHLDRGESLINWIAELRVPGEAPARHDWSREVPKSLFAHAFESWNFGWLDVPSIIEGAGVVYEYPMVDRDPVSQWSFGRVTLLGDAAHAMYPIGSNGASQAILDAAALGAAVEGNPRLEDALAAYEGARLDPTRQIVLANRGNGPEQVMQLAEERAPQGFQDIHDVISREELEGIALKYKTTAGFAPAQVNH